MSNILKGFFVSLDEDTRVVDTNDLVEKRVREEEEKKARLKAIQKESYDSDEFFEGLPAENIDALLSDNDVPGEQGAFDNDAGFTPLEYDHVSESEIPGENSDIRDGAGQGFDQMAQEVIAGANEEAERIIASASEEAEGIKRSAYDEGYNEGLLKAKEEADALKNSIEEEKTAFENELRSKYDEELENLESALVDKITDIYEHVFKVGLKDEKNLVIGLLQDAINGSGETKNIIVHVSKAHFDIVEERKEEILTETGLLSDNVEFIKDATLPDDGCMVETPNGVFDCSLSTELTELKNRLMVLAYK